MEEKEESITIMLDKNFTDLECKTFVECIMSQNISPDDVCRSLVGLGVNIDLSHEIIEESELDEDGELEIFTTSEFQNFVNESVDKLLYDKDAISWIKFYRKLLLKLERYELLHTLKLEKTWNI